MQSVIEKGLDDLKRESTPFIFNLLFQLRGVVSIVYLAINTLFWVSALFGVTLFKFAIPLKPFRTIFGKIATLIAECWIFVNNLGLIYTRNININVTGIEELNRKEWYLVISNHQTWVDIPILQKVFFRKIPFLKFFLKNELIWVPFLGPAWWALDFPFMKRYSRGVLKKKPHLKGKDMEITRKACEKFKDMPVSIMNFTEGTRFTKSKHDRQRSPFRHLLKPKAGGIGFVMTAMGNQLHYILDVTISYPQGPQSFWAFLCGRVNMVDVHVQKIPVADDLIGDYMQDKAFRVKFQHRLNDIWKQKDILLEQRYPV
ncbi:MAG: acyltransferase [SAR324 cluster bacterium]|nr:acyltransferase [SAR324 cluster bacterium]